MSTAFQNPYRKGSALNLLFAALARSQKPLTMGEIAERAKVPAKRTQTLIAALRNRFHNASLRRAGIEVALEDGGYSLKTCQPEAEAHRPPAKKAHKSGTKKTKKAAAKPRKRLAKQADKKDDATTKPETATSANEPTALPPSGQ